MSSPAKNLVEQVNDWEFIELWVDPIVFPPRILMLVGGKNSKCGIYEPSANYNPHSADVGRIFLSVVKTWKPNAFGLKLCSVS
ncbi:MAG: hypothetical protein EAZ60_10830, partial [Oscillatoriales cyanobacterium]